jgi:integrase
MPVYQENGIWRYRFMLRGVRHFASLPHCKTKTQARAAEEEARTRARRGELNTPAERTKFADFLRHEFTEWSQANHSPGWRAAVKRFVENFAEFFGEKTFAQISAFDVERYKSERRQAVSKRGGARSAASVNRELACLSSAFKLAIKANLIERNPCASVDALREGNVRERVLSAEEEAALFAVLRERHGVIDSHLLPMVTLAIHTGMRLSELLGLDWSEVDLSAGRICLPPERTKSGKRRIIPLNATARAALAELAGNAESGFVFINPETKTRFRQPRRGWLAACKAAGIDGLHFHDLRHTFISRLIEGGATLAEARDLAGHADLEMTNRYSHASEAGKSRAVESLAEWRERKAA